MHKSGKSIGYWSAVSLGIGAMIGAGIFALMGEAGSIANSAVYLSFLLGGGIALLSGYSMAKLGVRFPAAGGIVEYLVQGLGVNVASGTASLLFYLAGLVGMSLVAKAFGSYGAVFFHYSVPTLLLSWPYLFYCCWGSSITGGQEKWQNWKT